MGNLYHLEPPIMVSPYEKVGFWNITIIQTIDVIGIKMTASKIAKMDRDIKIGEEVPGVIAYQPKSK